MGLDGENWIQKSRSCVRNARAPQVVLVVKNLPANAGDVRCRYDPWVEKIPWRSTWQPTPVFLPGKSYVQRNLTGCIVHTIAQSRTRLKQLSMHSDTVRGKWCLQWQGKGYLLLSFTDAEGNEKLRAVNKNQISMRAKGFFAMLSHSVMSDSATPWTATHQASVHGILQVRYWSGGPFSPPEGLQFTSVH